MNNEDLNIQSGERLSFYKLFAEKGYQIEIPIIQRDYAQGRNSSEEVRTMFLDALYNYLEDEKPNRDLDFIYGSISGKNGHPRFIPLDGQQRLTTLFLLHWYLAQLSGKMPQLRQFLEFREGENGKSKFTYETRTSSREFCDALMTNEFDLKNMLPADEGFNNSLSKTVQDSGWYFLSWENDPTIQSMLCMLDDIHVRFNNKPKFFDHLIDPEKPVITFLFLNLKEFKLTDDLYIKMNARGKPLTKFENFKAKFEQHIGKLSWDKNEWRKLKFDDVEKVVSPKDYFSHKIDTDWANLFWQYRNVNGKDNSFDDELMNFIRIIFANECACKSKDEKDSNLEFLIGTQVARKRKDYTDKLSYHLYEKLQILTNDAILYLINSLDALSNGDKEIHCHLSGQFYFDEQLIFIGALKHELTLPQRVLFHAYVRCLIQNKGNKDGIDQWMRVIHNLVENRPIDGAEEVSGAIKSIEKLIPYSNNILDFLQNAESSIDFFYARQIQEERIKAHLINRSPEWEFEVEAIEKNTYLKGQICFLLEFSGILDFYEKYQHCDWDSESDQNYFLKFTDYSKKTNSVFNAIDPTLQKSSANIDFLWERAVLSKGDYFIDATACRRNILSTTGKMRDYSWKRLLQLPQPSSNERIPTRRSFVKEVFDDPNFYAENLIVSLENICKNPPSDWRKCLIEQPKLISYCKQGFIRFESDSKILLFKESQLNHMHAELFSFSFFLNELFDKDIIKPFANKPRYWEVRSGEEEACAVIDNWETENAKYAIDIRFKGDFGKYEIRFFNRMESDIDEYIIAVLLKHRMERTEKYGDNSYVIFLDSQAEVINFVKVICRDFENFES